MSSMSDRDRKILMAIVPLVLIVAYWFLLLSPKKEAAAEAQTTLKEQRLAAVLAAAQTRFDWERLIRELSRVMPAGSWLQTTQASVLGDPNAAALPTAAPAAVAPTGPSATLVGCTPKQSEVAKILVRLRSLHRVVDVELNESLREQGVQDVTIDSCGPLYKFDVTVTFAPAAEAEAPQGSNSVPASLGGGS